MLVYKNDEFSERVRFYRRWKYIEGAGLDEWRTGRQVLGAVYQDMLAGKLDPRTIPPFRTVPST